MGKFQRSALQHYTHRQQHSSVQFSSVTQSCPTQMHTQKSVEKVDLILSVLTKKFKTEIAENSLFSMNFSLKNMIFLLQMMVIQQK